MPREGESSVQILEDYWKEHPAWFGRPYGEYLHLGANQEMLRLLVRNVTLGEDARVLDVPSALGGNVRWLASLYRCRAEGVDPFKPAIVCARKLAKAQGLTERCRFHVAKVSELPFPDGVFNLALTADGEAEYREISRVLRTDGWFVGSTTASHGLSALDAELVAAGFRLEELLDVTDYALVFYQAKEQEAKLLVEAGLMNGPDLIALQMHTVDLYEAGGARHALFVARKN